MTSRLIKVLIAGTALAILPLNLAFAGGSTDTGSDILNGQVNLHTDISKVSTELMNVNGDAGAQSVAGGNVASIMTMNDTNVTNTQYSSSVNISSGLNANVENVGGSVGLTSQAVCNSVDVSTDPTTTSIYSQQDCEAQDPSSTLNATAQNIGGDLSMASSAVGNAFSADSNADNFPVENYQVNKSSVNSTVNANAYNVNGSVGVTSAAIGNNAQILHYSTSN